MDKIKIGRIVNTFGIKGELKVLSDSDFVEERFKVGNTLYLNNTEKVKVTSFREHNNTVLIKLNDLEDINLVEQYKNMDIFFEIDEMEALEKGYYLFQLEDLDVYMDDKLVGKVIEVLKPAQTVLRIKLEDREIMVPYVDAFVEKVDLDTNSIHIKLIEGF